VGGGVPVVPAVGDLVVQVVEQSGDRGVVEPGKTLLLGREGSYGVEAVGVEPGPVGQVEGGVLDACEVL
jgi:hypothetical protein